MQPSCAPPVANVCGAHSKHTQRFALCRAIDSRRIESLTSNEHSNDGEDFLVVGVRCHVTEPYTRQTGASEEQRRYVRRGIVWNVG